MTPDAILEAYPARVRALAELARRLVHRTVPHVVERAYPGWKGIGYRDASVGFFCGVFPQQDHVRLLFEHGMALPDPERLLKGTGSRIRYVVIRAKRDLRPRALRRLIQAATLVGATGPERP